MARHFQTGTGMSGGASLYGGEASSDDLNIYSNEATFATTNTGRIKPHSPITMGDSFNIAAVDIGGFLFSWEYKNIYVTGTQTINSPANIGATTVLAADHIIKYSSVQAFSAVAIFDGRPTIRPTTNITDTNADWRVFLANPSYSPELATATTATTTSMGGFAAFPLVSVASGSHASAAAVVTSLYSFKSAAGIGAQSTATTFRHFWAAASTVTGTMTTQIGLDVEAMTQAGTNIGVRLAKANTYTLQLSGTDGSAASGITFGTDTNLYRSAADTLKTDDKLLVTGELELDGALNHDGTTIGFFGVTPATQQTELTDELTTITHTAPGTPDYAVQDLTDTGGFGFVTKDEGNTVLSVIANLQTRVNELETKLTAYGLLVDAD